MGETALKRRSGGLLLRGEIFYSPSVQRCRGSAMPALPSAKIVRRGFSVVFYVKAYSSSHLLPELEESMPNRLFLYVLTSEESSS